MKCYLDILVTYCCDQIFDKSQLKRKGLWLTVGGIQSLMVEKSWQNELKAADHIKSIVRRQRETNTGDQPGLNNPFI